MPVLTTDLSEYSKMLLAKAAVAPKFGGLEVDESELNPELMAHVRRKVAWAIRGGRRAWFASFGLGKTTTQIETMRVIGKKTGKPTLIVAPLGVRREFIEQAKQYFHGEYAVNIRFIRSSDEVDGPGVYLTNYESVREGKVKPDPFIAVSLDEAAILRGFGGTKTFREFMALFAGDDRRDKSQTIRSEGVKFRFVATATPSPNDYIELLSYAAFLDIMDVSAAKTRFFQRDSQKADNLTIMPHKEEEFWLWVASWALFVTKPSDLDPAFSDDGYVMPPLDIHWHEIDTDHLKNAGVEKSGQMRMFADAAADLSGVAREKRDSLPKRIAKLMELRAENPDAHRVVWHDLEAERAALERAIPAMKTVYGSMPLDDREQIISEFADGELQELGAKPVMLGSGTNLQKHCHWAVFLGIGFKFNDFIQAVHRLRRFGQKETVRLDLIYTEAERGIRRALEKKWQQHEKMVEKMVALIREYGLSEAAMHEKLTRAMGVERIEKKGDDYRVIHNDCVKETAAMPDNSVQLIVTSIPFSTQYEYSPNYADFGHTDNDAHFWQQMGHLIPNLLRVLEPGRICAIHVKDRIIPGGISGYGFQTLSTLHMDCVMEFKKHGFAYLGMKTIVTDVVRENNQTYRLGWTEQCKDGSRMGVGVPEYLLIFRKPPTDNSNGYADNPVKKDKKEWDPEAKNWRNEGGYSRARWQLDAHGFAKSSGNRVISPDDLNGLDASAVYKLWRQFGQNTVYDYEHHVMIGEHLEMQGRLPPTFMLLQPHTLHPDVWTDVARMMTLNSTQAAKGKEQHLCPLQFDIVDRAIVQYTEPGEWVYDPFGGIGTVPYRAIKLGRKGICCELSPIYWLDACYHVEAASQGKEAPNMFDMVKLLDDEEIAA